MRHRRKTVRLQRKDGHRRSLLANQACSLIEHGRIRTTLAKAKALRPVAEKLITLTKKEDGVHARRMAFCRITKLGPRPSDSAPMAVIEWVDLENLGDDIDIDDDIDDAAEEGEE